MNNHLYLNWTHWTPKGPRHMTLEIQVLAWDRHENMVGLNQLMVTIWLTVAKYPYLKWQ